MSSQDLGRRLFTFAVIADTHVNQRDGESGSPWPVNQLANARNRFVVQQINRIAPAFVLHLGDIVHPVPEQRVYGEAASRFLSLVESLACPLYLTPGNHDVGDKPLSWMPAGTVTDAYIDLYAQHFGKHYYSFDANGCHFIVINAQIINAGLACEAAQRDWLEHDLAAHEGERIFLCTHYPPYVSDRAEPSSYDNIDEPGRSWLLALLERYRVEAVFAGHVHNFWYDRQAGTEFYILPSTAFVRQDYSEFYRIEPGPENGRNDVPKLGYFVVDVHERGHVAHMVRTYGATLASDDAAAEPPPVPLQLHSKTQARAPVGIDLRHPWAEIVEIAASGGVDEFERKRVRNDYPLLALWEMGVRKLRVPLQDLCDEATRRRMRMLVEMGHEFTVYSYDVPEGAAFEALLAHGGWVHAWELVVRWDLAAARIEPVNRIKASIPLRVLWSKLRTREDAHREGARYSHMIKHGFSLAEASELADFAGMAGSAVDGFVCRSEREASAWDDVHAAATLQQRLGKAIVLHVRLAASMPGVASVANDGETICANRVAETVAAALCLTHPCDTFLDTLNDVDRSFFARSGLVDRRYNPRLAGQVLRHLSYWLGRAPNLRAVGNERTPTGQMLAMADDASRWWLLLPHDTQAPMPLPAQTRGSQARIIDLRDGRSRPCASHLAVISEGIVRPVLIHSPAE